MSNRKRYIKVHPHSFHQALEALKAFEQEFKPIIIQKLPLSKFLLKASDFSTSAASIPNEVKIAILITYGYHNPDPASLKEEKSMSDFEFSGIQYISLTGKFNKIAKGHNPAAANISVSNVQNCDTVKDCIDLVTKASRFAANKIPAV